MQPSQSWHREERQMIKVIEEIFPPQLTFALAVFALGLSLLAFIETFRKEIAFIRPKRIALYLILIMFAVVSLLPIWVALTTSLKTEVEVITSSPLLTPTSPTLDAYGEALGKLGRPMINSLMFVTGAVVCSVVLGSILGYIFSKIRFRYNTLVFLIVAAGTFLPYTTIVFPLFRTISELNLAYSIPGMILTHTMYGVPVCALLFRNFYAEIPQNTIDKARKRGAGDWDIYRKIILPASGTAIVTVVMYQFTSIWNDFLFGLVLGGGETQAMPATLALAALAQGTISWSVLMAGAIIIFLPVVLVYIFLQKYFVRGIGGKTSET